MERIGLFGGSFDPVHLGHLLVAEAAREELALDRLYFIPAAQSPFKPDRHLAPANERLRLLRLALAGQAGCEIDEQEIRRGGVSYTVTTLRDVAARFQGAQLFYLIGADHVAQLPRWREAETLARLAEFVLIPRPAVSVPAFATLQISGHPPDPASVPRPAGSAGTGTEAERPGIFPAPFRGRALAGFPIGLSASQIRARVRAGLPIARLVPPAVAEAIHNNRLYL